MRSNLASLASRISTEMADQFTKAKRSEIMAAVRSRGNKETELRLAEILRSCGISGWRRHERIRGCPDFVFPRARLAVFVDGCFWHGCPKHCRMPAANRSYWQEKISRNISRDRATVRALKAEGWRVLRLWAHTLRHPTRVSQRIIKELSACRRRAKHTRTIL